MIPVSPMHLGAHGSKLEALEKNAKLPPDDKPRVAEAKNRYRRWIGCMEELTSSGDQLLTDLVGLLNNYKRFIDIDLIYDSPHDFLFRQKGQHKVDNSIVEEFLPRLANPNLVPGLSLVKNLQVGPLSAFAAFAFAGGVHTPLSAGGVLVRQKNQDYAVAKQVRITVSDQPRDPSDDVFETVVNVALLAAECKTNLDKTMFNEGLEAARALKQAVAGSRYLLICEWLDMAPIPTSTTPIDEAIILRKQKRLGAGFRSKLATAAGRRAVRDEYARYVDDNPLSVESFRRIVDHLRAVFPDSLQLSEDTVLKRGYF